MNELVKLTAFSWDADYQPVLIGTKQIINAEEFVLKHSNGRSAVVTRIRSVGAMVETSYVLETVDEIFELANKKH